METNLALTSLVLPEMAVMRCEFTLRAQETVTLPPYLGATLRGAFGTALKEVVCTVPHGDCSRCWFREACAYPYIFETPIPTAAAGGPVHPQLRGQKTGPHPYLWLAPPLLAPSGDAGWSEFYARRSAKLRARRQPVNLNELFPDNDLPDGAELTFGVWLVGRAVQFWPQVLVAVRVMADAGLGAMLVPFTLTRAVVRDATGTTRVVYDEDVAQLKAYGVTAQTLSEWVAARAVAVPPSERVRLRFVTPARILTQHKQLDTRLEFLQLFEKLTQRLEHLAALHATPPRLYDYRAACAKAAGVQVCERELLPLEWAQHSNTQERKVLRRVVLGEIEYEGAALAELWPLLLAGEILQVGAGTNYGGGRYVIIGQT